MQPAGAGTDVDAELPWIDGSRIKFCVFKRHRRRCRRELNDTVGALGLFFSHIKGRVKVANLARNFHIVVGRVESGDVPDAVFSRFEGAPVIILADANGADHAEPGDHDSSIHFEISLPPRWAKYDK